MRKRRIRSRSVPLVILLLLSALVSGCLASLGCAFCLHPVENTRKAKEIGRRIDPRTRAEHFKHVVEDGSLRDKDFGAYVAFVVTELRLKDVLQIVLKEEGAIRGYRVQTVDAFGTADGGARVAGRLEVIPDYGVLVNEGVKMAFGIWGKLLPDRMVKKVGRELTEGNRFVAQFLEVGVDESDLDFSLHTPGGEIPLGTATTDVGGRAVLEIPAGKMPANVATGEYALSARIAATRRPVFFGDGSKVAQEDGGLLFWRAAGAPAERVLVVNVSDTVFALDGPRAMRMALTEKRYDLKDTCTADALAGLTARGVRVVLLSGNPEGMVPLMREELARTRILGADARRVPLVFKPMNVGLDRETMRSFKKDALLAQKAFWGADAVLGYVGDDPEQDGEAAKAAGVRYLQLPKAAAGGWCAGMEPVVPPGATRAAASEPATITPTP